MVTSCFSGVVGSEAWIKYVKEGEEKEQRPAV